MYFINIGFTKKSKNIIRSIVQYFHNYYSCNFHFILIKYIFSNGINKCKPKSAFVQKNFQNNYYYLLFSSVQ